jgi:hypothetical protein
MKWSPPKPPKRASADGEVKSSESCQSGQSSEKGVVDANIQKV